VNAATFLSELRRRDIQVWAVGGQLHCAAKAGALTPELRDALQRHKNDILRALAGARALASEERAIVPLQPGGTRVPVFGAPGHNGDVFCYRALAQFLGEDQPFFGLQPPGVDGLEPPLRNVEELAAFFAGQIRAFQPRGPYVIAGYCAGGTIAFELAQQLSRGGAQVSLLALFGSPYPACFRIASQLGQRATQEAERIATLARELATRSPGAFRRYVADRLRRRRERLASRQAAAADPVLSLRARVERATLAAVRAYTPRVYRGRMALVLPSRQWDEARRWRSAATVAEEYYGPDSCSSSDMLREPNAAAIATLFRTALHAGEMS
jgi:thioesterase domain-containing protein